MGERADHLFFLLGGGGSGHDKLPKPAHQKALLSGNLSELRTELSRATIVPQGDVVGHMTRRENKLILMPGNAAGTATPVGIPACYCSTRLKAEFKTSACHALGKRNPGRSELCDATIVPQGDAVADMTRSENKLILMPGNAAGTATLEGMPVPSAGTCT